MLHPRRAEWERRLGEVFARIDEDLEKAYGDRFDLHPARPPHGTTANRAHDGLFNIGAAFSAGYGSRHGRGYIVEVRMVTLDRVPDTVRGEIEEEVARRLAQELPRAFPGRRLQVERDGGVYKIFGDLSLDRIRD